MKYLSIRTCDDYIFHVDRTIATQSQTIRRMMDDLGIDEDTICLPNKEITGPVFIKALDWCEWNRDKLAFKPDHEEFALNDLLKDWEKNYLKMPVSLVCPLMITANLLEIEGLKKLMVKAVGICTGAVLKPTIPIVKAKKVGVAQLPPTPPQTPLKASYYLKVQKRQLFAEKIERRGGKVKKIRSRRLRKYLGLYNESKK